MRVNSLFLSTVFAVVLVRAVPIPGGLGSIIGDAVDDLAPDLGSAVGDVADDVAGDVGSAVKGVAGDVGSAVDSAASDVEGDVEGLVGDKPATGDDDPAATASATPAATDSASIGSATATASATDSASASATASATDSASASATATATDSSTDSASVSSSATASAASASTSAAPDDGDGIDDNPVCIPYLAADANDISARDLEELEKRAGEEFWFRWEDSSIKSAGKNILQLAAHDKNFDDQAYKWISTDVSKVTRGKFGGRLATVYVLPAGTRAATLAAAKDFETTSGAQQNADFVTKDNEPGDVGIQGVAQSTGGGGAIPLDTFRSKVIRVVVKTTSAKGKGKSTFLTINPKTGTSSNTAAQTDQTKLANFC